MNQPTTLSNVITVAQKRKWQTNMKHQTESQLSDIQADEEKIQTELNNIDKL